MADRKVSELNAADAGNLHDAALLHAVDLTEVQAADQNVRATVAQVRTAIIGTIVVGDSTTHAVAAGESHSLPSGIWYVRTHDAGMQAQVTFLVGGSGTYRTLQDGTIAWTRLLIAGSDRVRLYNGTAGPLDYDRVPVTFG